jgi:NAD-dependent deacetylase
MPEEEMALAVKATTSCEIFLSIGTSSLVYPAASLPSTALRSGATVIEINPQPTPFTDKAQFVLTGAAGVVLPELLALFKTWSK